MDVLPVAELAEPLKPENDLVIQGDNAIVLPRLPSGFFDLIYIDPPFNTGRPQTRRTVRAQQDEGGPWRGFGGRTYSRLELGLAGYSDVRDDYLEFIGPKLEEARRLLADHGTLYFHIDYREAHYCKVLLDEIFGRESFLNEIIWAYDFGARSKRRWPAKHDTILVYVKDAERYWFDSAEVDREPYMAPGLQTAERAARGKLPVDVWWHTIVGTNSREKTGYPTQKPEGVVRRIVLASSRPGGWCLDFFAGSGTLGAVAAKNGRRFVLVDEHPDAIEVCRRRIEPLLRGQLAPVAT